MALFLRELSVFVYPPSSTSRGISYFRQLPSVRTRATEPGTVFFSNLLCSKLPQHTCKPFAGQQCATAHWLEITTSDCRLRILCVNTFPHQLLFVHSENKDKEEIGSKPRISPWQTGWNMSWNCSFTWRPFQTPAREPTSLH